MCQRVIWQPARDYLQDILEDTDIWSWPEEEGQVLAAEQQRAKAAWLASDEEIRRGSSFDFVEPELIFSIHVVFDSIPCSSEDGVQARAVTREWAAVGIVNEYNRAQCVAAIGLVDRASFVRSAALLLIGSFTVADRNE